MITIQNTARFNQQDKFLLTLFIAVVLHIIVILGVNFSTPSIERVSKDIHVHIINNPTKKAPKKAEFLAQDNQIGTGETSKKPQPLAQKIPSLGNQADKPIKKLAETESHAKSTPVQKAIAQPTPAKHSVMPAPMKPPVIMPHEEEQAHLSADVLQQQIMQLGSEIAVKKPSADATKIKFIESISAHKYLAAQYIKDWESKVERIGNLNYPEIAAKKNFSGKLTMDVGINADGSIYSIRITQSSGNNVLDEAAKQIVKMSAPFAPLPLELLKELKVLAISRVWQFSDETMTAQ